MTGVDDIAEAGRRALAVEAGSGERHGERDPELRISTPDGMPASLPVAWLIADPEAGELRTERLRTRAPGRLVLPRASLSAQANARASWVDVDLPSSGRHARRLDMEPGDLEMRVPRPVDLLLRAVEADGRPIVGPAFVELRVQDAPPPADRLHRVRLRDGAAVVPVVGQALRLVGQIVLADGRRSAESLVLGPAGATTEEHVIRMGEVPCRRLRLVEESGTALAGAAVEVRLADTSLRIRASDDADDHGIVRVFEDPRLVGRTNELVVLARTADGRRLHGTLRWDLAGRGAEVCDQIWMAASGLLVSGVCVDAVGHPVPGVELRLQRHAEVGAHSFAFGNPWRTLALTTAVSDSEGRFSFYGPWTHRHRLRIQLRLLPGVTQPVTAGAQGIRLELPARALASVRAEPATGS